MKKYRPFISLFIILILPLLIYGLMKLLSVQHYRPIETISEKIPNPDGSLDSVFKAVGDFTLLTQGGGTLTRDSLAGKIWVFNLFYGSCAEACDRIHSTMSRLQGDYAAHPEVRIVSLSIDPAHDSLATLDAIAKRVEANPHRWYIARTDSATLHRLVNGDLGYDSELLPDTLDHTLRETSLRLLDWNGLMRGDRYDGLDEAQTVRLAQHLKLLQGEWADLQATPSSQK